MSSMRDGIKQSSSLMAKLVLPPFEAPTSKTGTCPELSYDILHKIYTHCDIYTKRRLELQTNKAIFGHLRCTPTELADLHKIESSRRELRLFYRAAVTKDNDTFVHQMAKAHEVERLYGLQLAVRYGNRRGSWVLLALSKLGWTADDEEHRNLVDLAIRQQKPSDLADIAKLSEFAYDSEAISFFRHLLKGNNIGFYKKMDFIDHTALSYGLHLAGKYGYKNGAMILLSCDKLNGMAPPEVQKVVYAVEKRFNPSELEDLVKIRKSEWNEKRHFQSIIAGDAQILDSHEAMFGLHLALEYGSWRDVWSVLAWGEPDLNECKELVDKANSRMTQTELADIARIHQSNKIDKTIIWRTIGNIAYVEYESEQHLVGNVEVHDFVIQLAVRHGSIEMGRVLLEIGDQDRRERNFKVGQEAAEERAEYVEYWKEICKELQLEDDYYPDYDDYDYEHIYDDSDNVFDPIVIDYELSPSDSD